MSAKLPSAGAGADGAVAGWSRCSSAWGIVAAACAKAVVFRAGAAHAFAPSQHLHLVHADFGAVTILP